MNEETTHADIPTARVTPSPHPPRDPFHHPLALVATALLAICAVALVFVTPFWVKGCSSEKKVLPTAAERREERRRLTSNPVEEEERVEVQPMEVLVQEQRSAQIGAASRPSFQRTVRREPSVQRSRPRPRRVKPRAMAKPKPQQKPMLLGASYVRAGIADNLGEVEECNNSQFRWNDKGRGVVVDHCPGYKSLPPQRVELSVRPSGEVDSVTFDRAGMLDLPLGECLSESMLDWVFDEHTGDLPSRLRFEVRFLPCVPINGVCIFD